MTDDKGSRQKKAEYPEHGKGVLRRSDAVELRDNIGEPQKRARGVFVSEPYACFQDEKLSSV